MDPKKPLARREKNALENANIAYSTSLQTDNSAPRGTVIVEIQDGAQKVVSAVGQFANQLSS